MGININAPVTFRGNVGVNTGFAPNYPLQVGDSYAGGRVLILLQPGQTLSYTPYNSYGPVMRVFIPYEEGKPHGVVWSTHPDGWDVYVLNALQTINARLTSTWSGEDSAPLPAVGNLTKLPLYIGNSASEWCVHNHEERLLAESFGWISPNFLNNVERLESTQYLNACYFYGSNCSAANTNTLNWNGRTGFVRYF